MGALIWLASYPKSGNTWLRTFLHHLLLNPPAALPPDELSRFTLGDGDRAWYDKAAGRPTFGLSEAETAQLRPRAQALMTAAFPDSVFVKTHSALGEHHGTPLINPAVTAGAIYVLRDPRDVAISGAHHYGTDIDGMIERMANPLAATGDTPANVYTFMSSWSQHVTGWTHRPHPQLLVLRYEDMESRPLGSFGRIAQFLGLKPPKDRLERAIRFSSFKVVQNMEQQHGFKERSEHAERFFRVGRSGQWRKTLSGAQVARIERDHGEVMRKFGYL